MDVAKEADDGGGSGVGGGDRAAHGAEDRGVTGGGGAARASLGYGSGALFDVAETPGAGDLAAGVAINGAGRASGEAERLGAAGSSSGAGDPAQGARR